MMKSSRLRDRQLGGEDPVVAQESPQDAGPTPCQGDDGLNVFAALAALLEVEVPVRPLPHHAGLGRHVEHSSQAAAVALGPMQVASATTGVAGDGHQAGRRGQVTGVGVGREVAGGDDELGAEDRPHARQRLDDLGLWMAAERLADLLVNPLQTVVQGQDLRGQVSHDLGGDVLPGQRGLLSLGSLQRRRGDGVGTAHASVGQPGRQPGPAAAAESCRGLVARQQDQRALLRAVVEGPFQRGEDAGQRVAETVDHPDPVGHEVGTVGGQQREVGGQLGGHVDRREVPSVAGGFGDDVGVAGVGLRLAPVSAGHAVDRAAGHVDGLLAVGREQGQQQRGGRAGDVHCPVDLVGQVEDLTHGGQDRRLIVADLLRPQRHTGLVDHRRPVMPLARVDPGPDPGPSLAHSPLLTPNSIPSTRGTPRCHLRKKRPKRTSQSAARAPRRTGRPLLVSH
uniref:Putative transporter n=1 Tax=Streptomyces verticillus TaxID=29309 RepID=Q9FB34_9ACTN|nr:putative transporter [Streptomyces verticillus]